MRLLGRIFQNVPERGSDVDEQVPGNSFKDDALGTIDKEGREANPAKTLTGSI